MAINNFNRNYLIIIEMEAITILEEFSIISSREMVEFDQCDDCKNLIDEYLYKLCFSLGVHSRVVIFILCLFFYL